VTASQVGETSSKRRSTVGPLLGLILAGYFGLAIGYALATPRWNNPDEPAHFNYVRELAETGHLPVLQAGDWDADLLERLKASRFPDDSAIDSIRYEGHQPPLYYLIAAAAYRASGRLSLAGHVLVLKALSIVLGAGVVWAAFAVGRQVCPNWPAVGLLTAATAAFIPMYTAISAAINNDSLANALAALTVLALLAGARNGFGDRGALGLGLLLGLLVLTKLTVYIYVPLGLAVLAIAEYQQPGTACPAPTGAPRGGLAIRRVGLAVVAALAVSSWWLVRNAMVYGWTDPLATARHAQVVVGQPEWASLDAGAVDYFLRVLFRSFWGQFGWMGVVLPDWVYLLYLGLTLLGVVGLAVPPSPLGPLPQGERGVRAPLPPLRGKEQVRFAGLGDEGRAQLAILVAAVLLVFLEVAAYNLSFIQAQGRYLFPALVPIGVLLSLGWCRLASRFRAAAIAAALGVGLGLLDLVVLFRFAAPAFR